MHADWYMVGGGGGGKEIYQCVFHDFQLLRYNIYNSAVGCAFIYETEKL